MLEFERWSFVKVSQKIFTTCNNAKWPCWFKVTAQNPLWVPIKLTNRAARVPPTHADNLNKYIKVKTHKTNSLWSKPVPVPMRKNCYTIKYYVALNSNQIIIIQTNKNTCIVQPKTNWQLSFWLEDVRRLYRMRQKKDMEVSTVKE